MPGWANVKVGAPLAPYARKFGEHLVGRGYADLSATELLRLMADMSGWMAGEQVAAAGLTAGRIEAYCAVRRAAGYTARRGPGGLAPLVEFLRGEGAAPAPPGPAAPATAGEKLLARYGGYLAGERGVNPKTASKWVRSASLFLNAHPQLAGGGRGPSAADVTSFCERELPALSRSGAADLAAATRSFLRFAHLEGLVSSPLAQAVPAVAGRRDTGLPRGLAPGTASKLLASCDRRRGRGRRDHAVLMLLTELGLRAGEVARLTLDDLNWRAGELTVHGKGGRTDKLPLPDDAGAAVAGYLRRGRPHSASRTVFLRAIAPAVPLTPTGITWIVYAACDRAGLPRVGAHRLRHTLACDMLRAGVPLTGVGQVLRHISVTTTAIYAKVDTAALGLLVQPWPGGAA